VVGIRGSYFYDSSVSTKKLREEALRIKRNGIIKKNKKREKKPIMFLCRGNIRGVST